MKIHLSIYLIAICFLSESFFAQCTFTSTVADVTLQCAGGTLNRTAVAFNPNQNLYYSVNAGSSGYPIETFAVTGGSPLYTTTQAVDYRGLWWNGTSNTLEGNTYNSTGIYTHSLAAITFYALSFSTYLASAPMPNLQSQGHADVANNLVLYFNAGNIYKYNKTTGALISTIAITGLPTAIANINNFGIAFTGISGSEVAIYNFTNRCIYFINYNTGAYVSTCTLPVTAPNPTTYRTGFANNRFFLYESTVNQWYGYPILNSASGPTISIAASTTQVCSGYSVSLAASGASNYAWSTGANTSSIVINPTTSITYSVTGTNTTGCQATKTISILVNPGTSASPVASPSIICNGSSTTLNVNGVISNTWSPGSSNATSITVSPASNTSYTVQGTNSNGCISTAVITVTVDPALPVLSIVNTASATSGICPSKTVALTASGATTYTWTGGSTTVTNGVVFSPTIASGYTVTGGNTCGTTTAVTSVSVHPLPNITPVASSASLCSGVNLTLTGVGNSTAYVWSGGPVPITNGVGFAPSTTVTYTVIGTSALSCTASATVPVTVVTTPANFPTQNTGIVCIGGSSTLTATGATSYTWASATQTVFTPTFVVTPNVGITTYTVTKSNANCFDVKTISVVTNSLPTIFAIVNPTLVCALKPATLAVGGGQSYTWTAPGSPNFTFTGSTPVVSPSVSTTYSVAAFDGTCVNTTTVFLAANPNPTITTTVSSPSICSGQSVTLNANGGINYTWTATTGTFYTQSVTDTPTLATAYNVMGDNIFGCITGASTVVLVNPNPVISTSASKVLVCSGNPSTLYATGANTYTWDANANGAFTSSTIVNPTSPTSAIMIYTVQGRNSFPCQSSQTVQVAVFVPTLTVTGNTNTCYGGAIQLGAGGGNINTYAWYTSIGGSPYGFQTLNTTVTAAGIYTVNAMTSTLSVVCPATQTVAVGVYYNPTITATPDRTLICTKESVDLYGGGGVSYSWSNGSPGGTITVNPTNNTTYTVTGTDANGCVGTGTLLVKVSGCSGINELSNVNNALVLYPNPNNGEFTIEANADITLTLVNELGQVIKTINLSGINNYKTSITDLAKGIYFISGQKDNVQINQKVIVTK